MRGDPAVAAAREQALHAIVFIDVIPSEQVGQALPTGNIGRIIAAVAALAVLSRTGADARLLFLWLMVTAFFIHGLISLTVGPLSIKSVPVHLRASASRTVIAVGELYGGGLAPVIAGYLAHHFGIASIFYLAIGGFVLGFGACLMLRETAPSRTKAGWVAAA